jgi:diguanylate cyclase (GGDEF)-like protein/PAS domain S-box-containing protein
VRGPRTGTPIMLIGTRLTDAPDGGHRGYAFVSLSLESFGQMTASLATSPGLVAVVIDPRNRTVLSRAPDREHLVGKVFADHPLVGAMIDSPQGGIVETEGLDGVPHIFGFAPLPGVGAGNAVIGVGLARDRVLADANRRLYTGLAIAIVAVAAAFAAAWLFGDRSQLKPIRSLVAVAERLGADDMSARAALDVWQAPEFQTLGATLNRMAAAIGLTQARLRDSEARMRLLADNSADMIFQLDLDFRRTYVSPACREILGYGPDELIGTRPMDMVHPDDADRLMQSYRDLLAGTERATGVNRLKHRDGHWVWIEVHMRALVAPGSTPIGIVGAVRDISARKSAEDAQRASAALLRGAFDHTPDCLLVVSATGRLLLETRNRAAAAALPFVVGNAEGEPLDLVLPPAIAAKLKADLEHCIATGEVVHLGDAMIFGDGRRKWDVILAPILDDQDSVERIVITARETTERKLAEDLVRESSERYRLIADNVADVVVRLGRDLTCGFVSPACRELLGYEPVELIALPLADIVEPEDRGAFLDEMALLQKGCQTNELRFRARRADGSVVWIEATGRRLTNSDNVILVARDITRRKQIEDELEAANRQLKSLASRDGLTGLANRRCFDESLDVEWRRAVRDRQPLGLIMMDVDKFKVYNDAYGHQAGDDCLCAVARATESALLRPSDFAARYGGEEFVVVLPNTNETGTIEVAERIRSAVAAAGLEHRGNPNGIVTISAGTWASDAAALPNPREADTNLYAAKAGGRNRVVHAPAPLAAAG